MSTTDWTVLLVTLFSVLLYGLYKSRGQKDLESYFLSNRSMPWYIVLFSIMGTQASAITFLSAPGQAYTDGMRFVQYYFGLPLAMIVLCVFFLPVYSRLGVYTAYEFLEQRFDRKTRLLTSALFLLQRGLSTGISIYAPSLILSSLLGWNIYYTNIIMGGLLIVYTVTGGAKAVAYTQTQQLLIIFFGMFLVGYLAVSMLPDGWSFFDALHLAGASGKLNVITSGFTEKGFDWKDKYNLFSGLIGGFFLALSYFGTDQSQVGRYLTTRELNDSRKGLLMNGFVKIPMQFLILLCGTLVFSFYVLYQAPLSFNEKQLNKSLTYPSAHKLIDLQDKFGDLGVEQQNKAGRYLELVRSEGDVHERQILSRELQYLEVEKSKVRREAAVIMKKTDPAADTNDTNYIFLHFVVNHLPPGVVGLLIAIIFLAAWGSIAAALNSLSSSCLIDWHHRLRPKERDDRHNLKLSRLYTLGWGVFSILIAQIAGNMGSLIEAVNVLGSVFYGTILGVFCVGLFTRKVPGQSVFYGALITQAMVIYVYWMEIISFLWLNVIGCVGVLILSWLFSRFPFLKVNLSGNTKEL